MKNKIISKRDKGRLESIATRYAQILFYQIQANKNKGRNKSLKAIKICKKRI